MPPRLAFDARLVTTRTLTPTVRELVFERVDGEPMTFEAGQWCNVHLPVADGEVAQIKRSYSIASAPDGSPRFEIAVTLVRGGPASTWLHAAAPGVILPFAGPHGFFTRPTGTPWPSLFVATGTGITPMRSMLLAAARAQSDSPWPPGIVLLGVRHEEDILYAEDFAAIAKHHPALRFEVTLSQPPASWAGRRGYVQTHVPALWESLATLGAGEPHAYVCGLERMVSSVRDILRQELGIPRQQVHAERYD